MHRRGDLTFAEMAREACAVLRRERVLVSGGRVVKQDREPVPDDGPVLAAIGRLLKIAQKWVRLLGLDAAVTSHVEVITVDVIEAEISRLEAELASHDPDGWVASLICATSCALTW